VEVECLRQRGRGESRQREQCSRRETNEALRRSKGLSNRRGGRPQPTGARSGRVTGNAGDADAMHTAAPFSCTRPLLGNVDCGVRALLSSAAVRDYWLRDGWAAGQVSTRGDYMQLLGQGRMHCAQKVRAVCLLCGCWPTSTAMPCRGLRHISCPRRAVRLLRAMPTRLLRPWLTPGNADPGMLAPPSGCEPVCACRFLQRTATVLRAVAHAAVKPQRPAQIVAPRSGAHAVCQHDNVHQPR
jgi:hypothetical protein